MGEGLHVELGQAESGDSGGDGSSDAAVNELGGTDTERVRNALTLAARPSALPYGLEIVFEGSPVCLGAFGAGFERHGIG